MNPEWQTFLSSRGAAPTANGGIEFPGAQPSACSLHDLSHLGLIAVSGADAETFLQGQLTNDVREISDEHSQLSSHCSPKGRMLASFRIWRQRETYFLQPTGERVADLVKRLKMFVLRSAVTIDDLSDGPARIGLAGDCAVAALQAAGLPVPAEIADLKADGELVVIRLPGPAPRFEIIAPVERMTGLWDTFCEQAQAGGRDDWALMDIRAGIPSVYNATADAFVPQMANMQLVDGVSFTKGCYTGQEVIARMQYLGKLKRRMYHAEVQTVEPPRPGDALHASASTSEQASGRVVDARPAGTGRFELLAVVEVAATESGEVRLGDANGPVLSFEPPPYGFPAEAQPDAD